MQPGQSMDTDGRYDFVSTFLRLSLTCRFPNVLLYMKYRNEPTLACQDVVCCIEQIKIQVNTLIIEIFRSRTYFSLFAGGFLFPQTCPLSPQPSNLTDTYHPYPNRMRNFNLKEAVAAFYPPFSGMKFRHSPSSAH